RKAEFPVWGIVDVAPGKARELADQYGIVHVFESVHEAVAQAPDDAVYDLALMPEHVPEVLAALPEGSAVLIQKPLGHSLDQGIALREACHGRCLVAAVNTQLRFAPYVAEARKLVAAGDIGEVYDFELRVTVETPWHMFPQVFGQERLEFTMHSVHYMDLARSFFGDPDGVSATTVRHPEKPDVATTRSTIILRHRDRPLRVVIGTNHDHDFGPRHQESFIKWEGTRGAIRARMGLLMDYPEGVPDSLEIARHGDREWEPIPFEGSWFPDAFIGSMAVLQRFVAGAIGDLPTWGEDVIRTMAVVEAAYRSEDVEGIAANPGGIA